MRATMRTNDLKTVFTACKSFVAKTDWHPALQAVLLTFDAAICTAYAADGIKLMQIVVPCDKGSDTGEMLVPIVTLPKDPFVALSDEGSEITFDFGASKQAVKKYEDRFFETPGRFFPGEEPAYTIYFDAKNLKAALNGFSDYIKLDFFDPKSACVITQDPDRRALVFPVSPSNIKFKRR